MKEIDKRKDKAFEKSKNQPYITIAVKDFMELLFGISNLPANIREPSKEEIEFHKKHNQPRPTFTIEKAKRPIKKMNYID